jgi:uncharacterized membrane-anchored protein
MTGNPTCSQRWSVPRSWARIRSRAFTAYTLHLGYAASAAVFAVGILVPAVGYRWLGWNPILCFWAAYVITRPLGASTADWLGKPADNSGLGVVAMLGLAILVLVAYLAGTKSGVQRPDADEAPDRGDTALRR